MVDVGVGGDNRLALGQREIELADELENFVGGVLEADIDQDPFLGVIDEIDIAAEALTGLMVDLDDVGKDRLPLEHFAPEILRHASASPGPRPSRQREKKCEATWFE